MRPYLEGENLYNVIQKAVPDFVAADYPVFLEFVNAFTHFLEEKRVTTTEPAMPDYGLVANDATEVTSTYGGPAYETRKLPEYRDVCTTLDEFRPHFLNLFAKNWPQHAHIPSELFIKSLRQFYQKKGTVETVSWFFRAMFNQEAEVYFPREDVLRASDGTWVARFTIKVRIPEGYTDYDDADVHTYYVGQRIVTATGAAQVERVVTKYIGQSHGQRLVVHELTLKFGTVVGTFYHGQDVYNIDSTDVVHTEIISVISEIEVNSGGSNYEIGDYVDVSEGPGMGEGYGAWGLVSRITNTAISGVEVLDGGDGYVTGIPVNFVSIYGTNAAAYVDEIIYGNILLEDDSGYLLTENVNYFQYEDKNTLDLGLTIKPFIGANASVDPMINLGIDRVDPSVGTDYGSYAVPLVEQMVGVGIDDALEIALAAIMSAPFMHPWVFTSTVVGSETVALANAAATIVLTTKQGYKDGDRIYKINDYMDFATRVGNSSVVGTVIVADHTWADNSDYVYLSNIGTLVANTMLLTPHIMKASDGARTLQVGTLISDGTTNVVGNGTTFTTAITTNSVIRVSDTLHIKVGSITNNEHLVAQTAVGTTLSNSPWSVILMQPGTLTTNGSVANVVGTGTKFTTTLAPNTHICIDDVQHIVVKTVVNDTFFTAQSLVGNAYSNAQFTIIPVGVVTTVDPQAQRYYGKIRHITLTSPGRGYTIPPAVIVDSISARAQEITHMEP